MRFSELINYDGTSLDPLELFIRGGMTSYVAGWRQFVGPGDVVGIKVNPNGNAGTISSPAAIMEIVNGLVLAGVSPRNIILYERYGEILDRISGWCPSWVQTASATPLYGDYQTDIAGYDPAHFVDLPLFTDWQMQVAGYQPVSRWR